MLIETNDPRMLDDFRLAALRGTRWEAIRTRFVRDRMAETAWKDRDYIVALMNVEFYVERGGPKSFTEAMHCHDLRARFPLEYGCIEKEMKEGVYTAPEDFARLVEEKKRRDEEAKREELKRDAQRREEAQRLTAKLREEWLRAGGRP